MAIELYKYFDDSQITKFATEVLAKSNLRIEERIVTTLNENSNDKHMPSAKTVYDLIKALQDADAALTTRIDDHDTRIASNAAAIEAINDAQNDQDEKLTNLRTGITDLDAVVEALTHLHIEVITGDIGTIAEPDPEVLYFQRDDESDTTWMLYVHTSNGWVNIGDTAVDLSGYWTKDSTEELRAALGMHDAEALPDQEIIDLVDEAFGETIIYNDKVPTVTPSYESNVPYGTKLSTWPITCKSSTEGTIAWYTTDEEFATYNVGDAATVKWMFTPTDTEKYETVIGNVMLTITKVTPTVTPKYNTVIGEGFALSTNTISGASSVPGTFSWVTTDEEFGTPAIGDVVTAVWTFVPNEQNNYDTVTGTVDITIVGVQNFTLTEDNRSKIGYTNTTKNVVIPETFVDGNIVYRVTSIGERVFYSKNITSVSIPNSVISIGDYAFYGSDFTSVTIPDRVTSIGERAFGHCYNLKSVVIPASLTSIGVHAFTRSDNINTVYYKGTSEQWNAINISNGNTNLTDATRVYNYTG